MVHNNKIPIYLLMCPKKRFFNSLFKTVSGCARLIATGINLILLMLYKAE